MSREYRHVQEYEKEILELKEQGYTNREIGEKLGFTQKQIHNFIIRYNEKQRKLAAGIAIRKKGRPSQREMGDGHFVYPNRSGLPLSFHYS